MSIIVSYIIRDVLIIWSRMCFAHVLICFILFLSSWVQAHFISKPNCSPKMSKPICPKEKPSNKTHLKKIRSPLHTVADTTAPTSPTCMRNTGPLSLEPCPCPFVHSLLWASHHNYPLQASLHESLHRPPSLPLASPASRTTPPLYTRKAAHLQPTQSHPHLMYIGFTLHEKKVRKGRQWMVFKKTKKKHEKWREDGSYENLEPPKRPVLHPWS